MPLINISTFPKSDTSDN